MFHFWHESLFLYIYIVESGQLCACWVSLCYSCPDVSPYQPPLDLLCHIFKDRQPRLPHRPDTHPLQKSTTQHRRLQVILTIMSSKLCSAGSVTHLDISLQLRHISVGQLRCKVNVLNTRGEMYRPFSAVFYQDVCFFWMFWRRRRSVFSLRRLQTALCQRYRVWGGHTQRGAACFVNYWKNL